MRSLVHVLCSALVGLSWPSSVAFAKEDPTFIGVVQYLQGEAHWHKRPDHSRKEKIQFKSFFHAGDVALLEKDSHLKLVSQNRCKGIVYGPGGVAAPTKATTPVWTMKAKALRWICPEGGRENIIINGRKLQVQGGEVLYKDDRLLVLSGRALSPTGVLKNGVLYHRESNSWSPSQTLQENAFAVWALHNSLPLPKESLQLKKPKKPIASRWIFGPAGGGGQLKHSNSIVTDDYDWHGVRATSNFLWKERPIIASISWLEMDSDGGESGPFGPSDGEIFNYTRSDIFAADVGLRLYHKKSWSPYFKLGLAYETLEVDFNGNMGGFFFGARREQDLINTTLTAGIDKTFFTDWLGWGGLYLSAEAFYQITLFKGNDKTHNEYSDNTNQSRLEGLSSGIQRYGVIFHFGGMLVF